MADVDRDPATGARRLAMRTAGHWLAALVLLGFAWLAGGLTAATWPAQAAIFAAAAVILGLAAVHRRDDTPVHLGRTGLAAWLAWLVAVTGWELWALLSTPRSAHPTISSLTNELIASHPARAAAVLLWLLFGWWLARR